MRQAHFLMVFPGVGISYAINRYLQIGGVFLSGFGFFEQSQAIRMLPQVGNHLNWNELGTGDADLKVDTSDPFMPTGIFGVLSRPVDWLEIGAAVKLPVKIEAEGDVHFSPSSGDMPNADPLFRKPSAEVGSGGKSAAKSRSTPSKSRIVLAYSYRVRRRNTTRPPVLRLAADTRFSSAVIQSIMARR